MYEHWNTLKHVAWYIKGTLDRELTDSGPETTLNIHLWIDSSWGDNLDDLRFIHGYIFILGGGPIL